MEGETIIIYAIAAIIAISILVSSLVGVHKMKDRRYQQEQAQLSTSAGIAIPLVLWPIILDIVLRFNTNMKSSMLIAKEPWVLLAYIWPMLLMIVDLVLVRRRGTEVEEERRQSNTKNQANVLIGCAWAMGTLLAVIKTQDSGYSADAARILLISLITCIAFIIPTPGGSQSRAVPSMAIGALQKSALNYAIGFFVLGILVAWKR